MSAPALQVRLFQHIKGMLPPGVALVDDIAAILRISTDSAYRRIRGDKELPLEEAYRLCLHYGISLDRLMELPADAFVFSGSFIQPESFRFDQWLTSVVRHVQYMTGFTERKMYYLCKDIPVFHHFHFREIAALKHFVWMKSVFNAPEFSRRKFRLDDYPDELFALGQQALSLYQQIDCVEIWNLESINSTIRQVEYYHESNLFEREEDIVRIYEALEQLVLHLDRQAARGYKFTAGTEGSGKGGAYEMYLNEMVLGDNSVLALLDGSKLGFIIHTVVNVMTTRDPRFCDNMWEAMQNLVKRSTLISSVSERERARFFRALRKRIELRKRAIS